MCNSKTDKFMFYWPGLIGTVFALRRREQTLTINDSNTSINIYVYRRSTNRVLSNSLYYIYFSCRQLDVFVLFCLMQANKDVGMGL